MGTVWVAQVFVADAAYHFDKPYDYTVPNELRQSAVPGVRVTVPFGNGGATRQGIITQCRDAENGDGMKALRGVLDDKPMFSAEMLSLGAWLKEQTFCPMFTALKAMLPVGATLRVVVSYMIAPDVDPNEITELSSDERRLLDILYNCFRPIKRDELLDAAGLTKNSAPLDSLVKRGLALKLDDAVRRVGDASMKMVRLAEGRPDVGDKLTKKQSAVCELLSNAGAASVKETCYFAGVTETVVNNLAQRGIVELFEDEVYRLPKGDTTISNTAEICLNTEQRAAYDGLAAVFDSGRSGCSLLYGVTGSGKTQVYLKLIDHVIDTGRGVIVMVPEIALTPQTLSIFRSRYGDKVAVFHSGLSMGQRMDEWKRVKNGDAQIAVGTRSAVFAPFDDIGLIIMDEQQEGSYKSESSPRYHARDVARFRAAYHKALLCMASATPSVADYSMALGGRYHLFKLTKRYSGGALPRVITADMRAEAAEGNMSNYSRVLRELLTDNFNAGRQSILLLNRRGYNTYVSCRSCGEAVNCPNCSVSMTYHSANGRLMCHYCGHSIPMLKKCPKCGSEHMRYSGAGTQYAESELRSFLPNARILRLDADTTLARYSHEKKLGAFGRNEYDIMLGTQMVAKGLDFPNVTLVGVLNADGSLYSNDYLSCERSFSLLTQVVGRSGRGDTEGCAVIQTFTPDNPVIALAAAQDYEGFYKNELANRRFLTYPPFCDLCVVTFSGETSDKVSDCADAFLADIKRQAVGEYKDVRLKVLGPSPDNIVKIGGRYRYLLTVKTHNNARFRQMISELLIKYGKDKAYKSIIISADVNPA